MVLRGVLLGISQKVVFCLCFFLEAYMSIYDKELEKIAQTPIVFPPMSAEVLAAVQKLRNAAIKSASGQYDRTFISAANIAEALAAEKVQASQPEQTTQEQQPEQPPPPQ